MKIGWYCYMLSNRRSDMEIRSEWINPLALELDIYSLAHLLTYSMVQSPS